MKLRYILKNRPLSLTVVVMAFSMSVFLKCMDRQLAIDKKNVSLSLKTKITFKDLQKLMRADFQDQLKAKKQVDILLAKNKEVLKKIDKEKILLILYKFFVIHRDVDHIKRAYQKKCFKKFHPNAVRDQDTAWETEIYSEIDGILKLSKNYFQNALKELQQIENRSDIISIIKGQSVSMIENAPQAFKEYASLYAGAEIGNEAAKSVRYQLHKKDIHNIVVDNLIQQISVMYSIVESEKEQEGLHEMIETNSIIKDYLQQRGIEI